MIEQISYELQEKSNHQKNSKNKNVAGTQTLKPYLLKWGIRYLGLINKQGRLKDEVVVSSNDFDLSIEKKEMLFMALRLQASMQNDFDDELGPVWYNVTERKNIKFLSIPTGPEHDGDLIFATMKSETDHSAFIKNILFLTDFLEKDEKRVAHGGITAREQ